MKQNLEKLNRHFLYEISQDKNLNSSMDQEQDRPDTLLFEVYPQDLRKG